MALKGRMSVSRLVRDQDLGEGEERELYFDMEKAFSI